MTQHGTSASGVACPACGHTACGVKDSRPKQDNACIRRRRLCESCGFRFTTEERVVSEDHPDFERLEIHEKLMAQAAELQGLARSIMGGRDASGMRRRVAQCGAVAIQGILAEEAWVNRYEAGRPWRQSHGMWSMCVAANQSDALGRAAIAPPGATVWARWSGPIPCDPEDEVYYDDESASYNIVQTGFPLPGWRPVINSNSTAPGLQQVRIP